MISCRFCALIRRAIPYNLQRTAAFSSAGSRGSNVFDSEGGSAVYRHALLFQRPTVVESRHRLRNSVCFIGTVMSPPRIMTTRRGGRFGAYTLLNVETPAHSSREFRILLQMWNDMANVSLKHLKPNDFIYVSGFLRSYEKVDGDDGSPRIYYTVTVKELNYVSPCTQAQPKSVIRSKPEGGITGLGKKEERLHLWQIYFASPHEWWDNRQKKKKKNPGAPDFRHKDTGEALWLNSEDPPWVGRQLQLLDSRMSAVEGAHQTPRRVTPWVYDD